MSSLLKKKKKRVYKKGERNRAKKPRGCGTLGCVCLNSCMFVYVCLLLLHRTKKKKKKRQDQRTPKRRNRQMHNCEHKTSKSFFAVVCARVFSLEKKSGVISAFRERKQKSTSFFFFNKLQRSPNFSFFFLSKDHASFLLTFFCLCSCFRMRPNYKFSTVFLLLLLFSTQRP